MSLPMRSLARRAVLGLIAAAAFAGLPAMAAEPLTVFAAASLKNALDEVDQAYAAAGGPAVRASYAGSSALARQIEQGAPADVFVSADKDWMDYVEQRRLIVAASRTDLLSNHLALIAPASSKATIKVGEGMPLAAALGSGRLSIADLNVPAGKYGQASLQALGVWDSVKDRLAPAENVRAALTLVALGEAPFGVVYDTDAKVEPRVRIMGLFPDSSHPPIVYPAAVVAASRNPATAGYLRFLHGPKAKAIFSKYGFIVRG